MDDGFETVHTMTDYWDGPREGVADYHGIPHVYQSVFDDVRDEWSDIFLLKSIDSETFQLVLEAWQIWLRWKNALHSGVPGLERRRHPAIDQDRQRRDELEAILDIQLQVDPVNALRAKAIFKFSDNENDIARDPESLLVKWFDENNE